MKKVYIAGPMHGYRHFNFEAFDEAAGVIRERGDTPISPADLDRHIGFDPILLDLDGTTEELEAHGFSVDEAIDRDVKALRNCDAIYVLPGHEESRGATAEIALAKWIGLEVEYETPAEKWSFLEDRDRQEDVLEEALRITAGDRQASYGPPDQDFQRTAKIWSAIKGIDFEAREVALFMIALKISRETHQRKRDNWVDMAGYSRCGSLCS